MSIQSKNREVMSNEEEILSPNHKVSTLARH